MEAPWRTLDAPSAHAPRADHASFTPGCRTVWHSHMMLWDQWMLCHCLKRSFGCCSRPAAGVSFRVFFEPVFLLICGNMFTFRAEDVGTWDVCFLLAGGGACQSRSILICRGL